MKKASFFLIVLAIILIGCASYAPESYDSFSQRTGDFYVTSLAVSESGLSREMMEIILSTKFPADNDVSIAVIFLNNYSSYNANNNGLPYYIMSQGKNINYVEKLVPVPRIFIPRNLTFDTIQELGIRNLCEYTLIFYSTSSRSMTFSQWLNGEFKFESDIEFSLIDNQTTAIIASDRLYSSIIKKRQSLGSNDIEEAEDEIYTLQADLLAEKLNALFSR